jgi:hypothetical protein
MQQGKRYEEAVLFRCHAGARGVGCVHQAQQMHTLPQSVHMSIETVRCA